MKYITTDKHPELKEGLIIQMWSEGHELGDKYSTSQGLYVLFKNQLDSELKLGYIKEVEKFEFTKFDMIAFHYWAGSVSEIDTKEDFNEWKKLRSK